MIRAPFIAVGLLAGFLSPAAAGQSLIPTPYPSGVSGAAPLDPSPQRLGGPQEIIKDPYPQILGANAQGDPPIARRQRRQHLVGSINERRYRVDRLPTYQP